LAPSTKNIEDPGRKQQPLLSASSKMTTSSANITKTVSSENMRNLPVAKGFDLKIDPMRKSECAINAASSDDDAFIGKCFI
jgi:hypothetical protein